MLLWITLLCLFPATFAAFEFASPELLADYGPNTSLQPLEDAWRNEGSTSEPHLIRGLLVARDTSPSVVGLQGRAPPNDLHHIPGPLIARGTLPLDGLQHRAPPGDLHLIPGLLMIMGIPSLRQDMGLPGGIRIIRGPLGAREVSPDVFVDYDLDAALQPLQDPLPSMDSSEGRHLIRGLLWPRDPCPTGSGQCSNDASKSVFLLRFLHHYLVIPSPFAFPLGCLCLAPGNIGVFEPGIPGGKVHVIIMDCYREGSWNPSGSFVIIG